MEKMFFEMESRSYNEQFARVVTAVFVARLDPTVEELEDIKTAVSEAVTNCIIHGYEGGEGRIRVEVILEEQTVTIHIMDWGVGMSDIEQAMEPLYTSKPGEDRSGMGFSFMEAFMDELSVRSVPGEGTVVTMKKMIGKAEL